MKSFPGSIMNLSNTGGGGRGSDQASIVGDVILHGKKKYWMRGTSHGLLCRSTPVVLLFYRLVYGTQVKIFFAVGLCI